MASQPQSSAWEIRGEYMEACSCDFLCPCITKNSTTPATYEYCKVALAFEVESGRYGAVSLAGVRFVLFAQSRAIMSEGDWAAGLVVDSAASDEQTEAVAEIASGRVGGPPAHLLPLITDFRGVERHPIHFERSGHAYQVKIEGLLDQSIVGVESVSAPGECIVVDNVGHPVAKRLNLATAVRNVIRAFGIEWSGEADQTNGHFAPFDWRGEVA